MKPHGQVVTLFPDERRVFVAMARGLPWQGLAVVSVRMRYLPAKNIFSHRIPTGILRECSENRGQNPEGT
jgi:hypothetical protein